MASTKTEICNLALSELGNERVQISDFDTDTDKIARQCRLHYDQVLEELVRMHKWNCAKGRIKLCTDSIGEYPTTIVISDGQTLTARDDLDDDGYPVYENDAETRLLSYHGTAPDQYWYYRQTDFPGTDTYKNYCDLKIPPKTGWSEGSEGADAITITYDYYFGWSYVASLPEDCIRPVFLTSSDTTERYFRPHTEWTVENGSVLANYEDIWLMYVKKPDPTKMDSLFTKAFYTLLASNLATPITGKRELKRELYDEFLNVIMPEARRVNSFEGYEYPMVDSEWIEASYVSPSIYNQSLPPFAAGDYGQFAW